MGLDAIVGWGSPPALVNYTTSFLSLFNIYTFLQHRLFYSTSRAVRDGWRGGGGHHKLLNICSKSVFLYVIK